MSEIKPNDNAYYIPEKPVYDPVIRALKTSDPANADTVFNPLFSQIIENVHAVNLHANNTDNEFKEHSNNKNNPHNVTAAQAGAYLKAETDTKLENKANVNEVTQYKIAEGICNDPSYKPAYIGDVHVASAEDGAMPEGASWFGLVHIPHRGTGYGSQISVSISNNPSLYFRSSKGEEWSLWNKVATEAVLNNHTSNNNNPHNVTAAQTGAYSKAEMDIKLDKKVSHTAQILKEANLDEYTSAGLYCIGSGGQTVLNAPISTGAFSLFVEQTGAYGNGVKQTFTDSLYANTYIRTSNPKGNTGWTQWNKLAIATDWQKLDLTCDSDSEIYYKKIDDIVYLRGIVVWKSQQSLPSDIAVLPEGFRPKHLEINQFVSERGVGNALQPTAKLNIKTDGKIIYSANSNNIVHANAGLELSCCFPI